MYYSIILFISICFVNISLAQIKYSTMIQYKYSYKTDISAKQYEEENMVLLINNEESMFTSSASYMLDSLRSLASYTSGSDATKMMTGLKYRSSNDYFINVNRSTNTIKVKEVAEVNPIIYPEYQEKFIPNWVLSKETKTILGIVCLKATTKLFGRNWIAWYAKDVPVPFGPYKFYNLPGLIISIQDELNTHKFEVFKIKRSPRIFPKSELPGIVKMTKENTRNVIYKGKFTNALFEGQTIKSKEMPDFMEKRQKKLDDEKKRYNNPIELTIEP